MLFYRSSRKKTCLYLKTEGSIYIIFDQVEVFIERLDAWMFFVGFFFENGQLHCL